MKLLSVVGALAVVFALTSCNQDLMEATYTPDNNNVTFEVSSTSVSLEGQPIVVKINRGVAKEAISIPLTLTDAHGVYTLNKKSADFAAGEYSTEVTLTYNVEDLKPVVNYAFTLSFNEADMALSGTNKITGNCQMPLVYKDWGTIIAYKGTLFQFFAAADKEYKIQLAENTKNYFKIVNFMGGGVDFEFNITNDQVEVTAPKLTANKYFPSSPMAGIPTIATYNGGQLTCWIDTDPEYIVMGGLSSEGTLQVGSIIQFDTFWTTPSTYMATSSGYWFASQFAVTAVN